MIHYILSFDLILNGKVPVLSQVTGHSIVEQSFLKTGYILIHRVMVKLIMLPEISKVTNYMYSKALTN